MKKLVPITVSHTGRDWVDLVNQWLSSKTQDGGPIVNWAFSNTYDEYLDYCAELEPEYNNPSTVHQEVQFRMFLTLDVRSFTVSVVIEQHCKHHDMITCNLAERTEFHRIWIERAMVYERYLLTNFLNNQMSELVEPRFTDGGVVWQ